MGFGEKDQITRRDLLRGERHYRAQGRRRSLPSRREPPRGPPGARPEVEGRQVFRVTYGW
jgi:hypothetical protein